MKKMDEMGIFPKTIFMHKNSVLMYFKKQNKNAFFFPDKIKGLGVQTSLYIIFYILGESLVFPLLLYRWVI